MADRRRHRHVDDPGDGEPGTLPVGPRADELAHGLSVLAAVVRRPRYLPRPGAALRAAVPDALRLRRAQAAALPFAAVGGGTEAEARQRRRRIRYRPLGDVERARALQPGGGGVAG